VIGLSIRIVDTGFHEIKLARYCEAGQIAPGAKTTFDSVAEL
jgi:hypothetical protein